MSYVDTFFARVNHLGNTTAERIRNGGIRSFYKWMAESPHTVNNLSTESGKYFSGIILTDKDKEYQKIMYLNVGNDIPIHVGDIMNWILDDKSIEKWLLIQEEKKVNGTYKTFWIVRCNYLVKWIDANGHLQQSWAYLVSSVDSKIKGNYRTWNSLITPQPNKYLEILMPRFEVDRATHFIVENESWDVIEYDHTSVPGVVYLSLTESKINLIYDDLDNNVADIDRLAKYTFAVPETPQTFAIGDAIDLSFTLMKDGNLCTSHVDLTPMDKTYVREVDNRLTAVAEGSTKILAQVTDCPDAKQEINIVITSTSALSAYIEGPDIIRLDRKAEYKLQSTQELDGTVTYTINNDLAEIVSVENNVCTLHANAKNNLGGLVLTATYNNVEYVKTINIVPIW